MRSSYQKEDVEILLKDITGMIRPQPAGEREKRIQAGTHYCEMLPLEYCPTAEYLQAYEAALEHFARPTAKAVGRLAEKISRERGKDVVLVSLARAGIPIGILLKRYLEQYCGIQAPHYAISIIRGRGIDGVAMDYLLARYAPERLLFVDGWVGKGAILQELQKAAGRFAGVSPQLAVAADPANVTELCGTHEDILIPSSCLNATVSGLISRTVLRGDLVGAGEFHGAVYYGELREADLSCAFIHAIEQEFCKEQGEPARERQEAGTGLQEVLEIQRDFQVGDINLIKPGIGETTRVLLRRVPWKILVSEQHREDVALRHIRRLAGEKGVMVEQYPLRRYKACGIIRSMADV